MGRPRRGVGRRHHPRNGGRADARRSPPRSDEAFFSTPSEAPTAAAPTLTPLARARCRRRRVFAAPASSHCGNTLRGSAGDLARTTDGRYPWPSSSRTTAPPRRMRASSTHLQLERALGVRCFLGGRDDGSDDGIRASAQRGSRARARCSSCRRRACSRQPSVLLECYDAVTRRLPLVCVRLISEDVDAYDEVDTRAPRGPPHATSCRGAEIRALAALEAGAARLGTDVRRWRRRSPRQLPQRACELVPGGHFDDPAAVRSAASSTASRRRSTTRRRRSGRRPPVGGGARRRGGARALVHRLRRRAVGAHRLVGAAVAGSWRHGRDGVDVAPPSCAGGDAPVRNARGKPRPWTQVSGAGSRRRLSVGAVQFEIDDELSVAHEVVHATSPAHVDL